MEDVCVAGHRPYIGSSDVFCVFRSAAAGDHVLFRLHVGPGQLLCIHDLLPGLRLAGAGGEFELC